jgi:hypothetical protein
VNIPSNELRCAGALMNALLCRQDDQLSSGVVSLNDCIQILFHPIHRHLILIVYPREILIFDLQILQTVGTVLCEKNSAAFYKVDRCPHVIVYRGFYFRRSMDALDVMRSYVFTKAERLACGADT